MKKQSCRRNTQASENRQFGLGLPMECYNLHCWGEEDTSYTGPIIGYSLSPPLGEGGTPSHSLFIHQATENEQPRSQSNSPAHCTARLLQQSRQELENIVFSVKSHLENRLCKPLCHNYSPLFLEHESSHRQHVSECICLPPEETVYKNSSPHLAPGLSFADPGSGQEVTEI